MALTPTDFCRVTWLAALMSLASLAGCSEAAPDRSADQAAAAIEPRSARGTGTVIALDPEARTITVEHGPMPDIGWSAMTMTFAADPVLFADIKRGDRVAFDLTVSANRGTITAMRSE